jgi:hypothetical protein
MTIKGVSFHPSPGGQLSAVVDIAYPTAPVVAVVCDNVIIHRSKLVQAWLAAHPRMRVLHGARYSPTTTRPSGSGPCSRRGWPTVRQPPSKAASARSMPSSASKAPPRCWPPPHPTVHPGCPESHTELQAGRLEVVGIRGCDAYHGQVSSTAASKPGCCWARTPACARDR